MGNNHDPVTLHKYLYANADPGNMIDPTGNFSMGSMMSAINVMGRLSTIATTTYDVFQIATGEEEVSAKSVGSALIFNMLGGSALKAVGLFGKGFKKCNSFDGDELVSTADGLSPISELVIGDMVWALDEENGEVGLQEVVHLITGEGEKSFVDIKLQSGEIIQATEGHPFYESALQNWVDAGDLGPGSLLKDIHGKSLSVVSVTKYKLNSTVYNITVNKDHTYFVGKDKVLNHNKNVCGIDLPKQLNNKITSIKKKSNSGNTYDSIPGSVTVNQVILMGMSFVGPNFTIGTGRKGARTFKSEDGLRQFTYPTRKNYKFTKTGYVANFETRYKPSGKYTSNVHVDVKRPK